MTDHLDLTGLKVLITRPVSRAQSLAHTIEQAGGTALVFPSITIMPPTDTNAMQQSLMQSSYMDYMILTSVNALHFSQRHLLKYLRQSNHGPELIAIGPASAGALEQAGLAPASYPTENFSSEGLLALPQLQTIEGQAIMLLTGERPRPLLAKQLKQRGARLTTVFCYRRDCPTTPATPLYTAWARGKIDVAVITSQESLQNLWHIVGLRGQADLQQTALVVNSPQLRAVAQGLGWLAPIITVSHAADSAIVSGLARYYEEYRDEQYH